MTTIEQFNEFQIAEGLPTIRTRWEVCDRCRGRGTLGGFPGVYTQDDFDSGDVDLDEYLSYSRTCEECNGRTTVLAVDRESSDKDARLAWDEWCREEAEYRHIEAMERRMGA